jgi:hypothetical protein
MRLTDLLLQYIHDELEPTLVIADKHVLQSDPRRRFAGHRWQLLD